ncbi:hypothetical protein ZIOFF_058829 [Zingiber officinale]|uniref:K Homology domain-containing protein n=1 Tax=Zingiber officinale TaxID=94328 RepID=A0A8J5FAA8_ZINOF|nr:hypothetical protein ZIOFF_058829 [Zingiber officinale]
MADSEVQLAVDQAAAEEVKSSPGVKVDGYSAAADETVTVGESHKRKIEDPEFRDVGEETPLKKQEVATDFPALAAADDPRSGEGDIPEADVVQTDDTENDNHKVEVSEAAEVKTDNQMQREDAEVNDAVASDTGKELQELETKPEENGKVLPEENVESVDAPSADAVITTRKIEVPNNKVGVLIGKSGETIRYLQYNSGAKIQITRDAEADPSSNCRPVELIGSLDSVNRAEKLVKDVIAEAEAGGSPSLVARGFGTLQSGGEQFEITVPNEKVGIIIGKGGETIKNLQTRSGARIQLIPQHLPEGDASKERIVRVTGDQRQIESAKQMIKEVMNQISLCFSIEAPRPSPLSGYNQQSYRHRGSNSQPHWGAQANSPAQPAGFEYQQRGTYPPSQSVQYPQPYGGYSQQFAPQGGFSNNAGWDQRSSASAHNAPSSGYDYYGHSGFPSRTQTPMANPMSGPSPAPMNYGQSQPPNYGHSAPYGHPTPTQQNYGQGYNDPRYDTQAPGQQFYNQQTMGSQSNIYGQGTAPQSGYSQQPSYNKQAYGAPQEGPTYGMPPRGNQLGDPTYQGHAPSYGSAPQQYPYGSNAASQSVPAYNQTYGPVSGAVDGYAQTTSATFGQAPGYPQPTASQPSGYGQYPTPQPGYSDPAAGNTNYGYHGGSAEAAYSSNAPASGYGAPPDAGSQPGYAQQPANPPGYQYDSTAPYAHH